LKGLVLALQRKKDAIRSCKTDKKAEVVNNTQISPPPALHSEHPFPTTSDMIEWNVYVGVIVEAKAWQVGRSEVLTYTTSCCFFA